MAAGTFSRDIAAFVKKTRVNADIACRKVSIELQGGVVRMTPVDTGRARGNWGVTIGAAQTSSTDDTDPGQYGDDPGAQAAAKADAALANFTAGPSIFITNALPYIERLETGYSTQAPAGMVAVTLLAFDGYVKKVVEGMK